MKKNITTLGKFINEAREKKGISQRELARLSNMDCAEISRIEADKRLKPNILYLKGISEVLNLSLVELMTLAGYTQSDIVFGQNIDNLKINNNYQEQIKNYEIFYHNILEEIEKRRSNAFSVKGIIADLIDRIELSNIENKTIPNDEILEDLKKAITMIRPNLEKVDKSIYPNIDNNLTSTNK